MRVPRQASSSATGRLLFQLKAKGQEKGEETFEKCLAIAKGLKVASSWKSTVIVRFSCVGLASLCMGHPHVRRASQLMT